MFDEGSLVQGGDDQDSLVVLHVRDLNTQMLLNTAGPHLL